MTDTSTAMDTLPTVFHLPETVTKLETRYGIPVYLVGTAHFSKDSITDVAQTIQTVIPSVVVVELCPSRTHILQLDEKRLLEEAEKIDYEAVSQSIKRHGFFKGIVYILFLKVSAQTTKMLGMAPGGEFRIALQEAQKINGCSVMLGDRQIEITIQRALSACSLWQKIKIFWHLAFFNDKVTQEDVEKCKKKDILQELLEEMAGEFPQLTNVFLNERDTYLAISMHQAAYTLLSPNYVHDPIRSRAVVGVVGIGHVAGIVKKWNEVRVEEMKELTKLHPPSKTGRLIRFTFKWGCVCGVVYLGYRFLPWQKIGGSIEKVSSRFFDSSPTDLISLDAAS